MAVYLPNPSTAMLKIPPHITLVQRPTRRNARIPTGTSCQITLNEAQSIPGTSTVLVSGHHRAAARRRRHRPGGLGADTCSYETSDKHHQPVNSYDKAYSTGRYAFRCQILQDIGGSTYFYAHIQKDSQGSQCKMTMA